MLYFHAEVPPVVGSLNPPSLRESGGVYMTLSIGQSQEQGELASAFLKMIGQFCWQSTFHSHPVPRPFSQLAGLTAQVRIFTKTSTAVCVPGTGATTKATRPYGPDDVTHEQMACMEPGNGIFFPERKRLKREIRRKSDERGVTC